MKRLRSWIATRLEMSGPQPIMAILGSGPSLRLYHAEEPYAIAVNGAALSEQPYHLFMCGDLRSPRRPWFYESCKHGAHRLVSSFVAPQDKVLYPDRRVRRRLRIRLGFSKFWGLCRRSFRHVYDFAPSARPARGHGWFQYSAENVKAGLADFDAKLETGRMMHGATIAGVALQAAVCLGARTIRIYGVSMDNDVGGNYFRKDLQGGRSTELQRELFRLLLAKVRELGVEVDLIGSTL
jgi:hypothetical protein